MCGMRIPTPRHHAAAKRGGGRCPEAGTVNIVPPPMLCKVLKGNMPSAPARKGVHFFHKVTHRSVENHLAFVASGLRYRRPCSANLRWHAATVARACAESCREAAPNSQPSIRLTGGSGHRLANRYLWLP